ncbi:MAG: SpoIIE family protein phosphatase [Longimicrobiaceae bacterium]
MTRESPAGAPWFALEVPADTSSIEPAVIELVERCRLSWRADARSLFNLRAAVTEALTNAVLYGGTPVRLEASLSPERLSVIVSDRGAGFDPGTVPDPTLPENIPRPGGRGVFLLQKLVDEVEYSRDGNAVRLVLRTPSSSLPSPSPFWGEEPGRLLDRFRESFGTPVTVWVRTGAQGWAWVGGDPARGSYPAPDAVRVPDSEPELLVEAEGAATAAIRFLGYEVSRAMRHEREVRNFSRELVERYEEITLLYSISEILGSVAPGDAAATILAEVTSTLGVRRAVLWVHDPDSGELVRAAAVGEEEQPEWRIPTADPDSVTAEVFRARRAVILDADAEFPRADLSPGTFPRESFLSVPVSYSPPAGETRTIGVINLIGQTSGEQFTAGDLKLLSAVASQIGAALENGRLVAEGLERERLLRELELARDLQLRLLPPLEPFRELADVAARCVQADSVGGDFYHLVRLPGGRLGVMIGDVSSHGFSAALIMALTMSAVSIHASEGDPPARVLRRVHRALIDELESTEMYLTLFYGVIDPVAGTLCYANAGHPHAFRMGKGEWDRLPAINPPLGIADLESYSESEIGWSPGDDFLLLFTDGLGEAAGEEPLLREAAECGEGAAEEVVDRLFALAGGEDGPAADDRTAVVVRV